MLLLYKLYHLFPASARKDISCWIDYPFVSKLSYLLGMCLLLFSGSFFCDLVLTSGFHLFSCSSYSATISCFWLLVASNPIILSLCSLNTYSILIYNTAPPPAFKFSSTLTLTQTFSCLTFQLTISIPFLIGATLNLGFFFSPLPLSQYSPDHWNY